MRPYAAVLLFLAASGPLAAQAPGTATPAATPVTTPVTTPAAPRAAAPADVASDTAIIHALYAAISGPKGAPRDTARLRTLFAPNARMVYTAVNAEGRALMRNWSVEEYITVGFSGLEAVGFYEREIGRTTERFGNVTHVMSAYDSKHTPDDPKPFQRGVNSIQLFNAGTRWYIVSVMWDSERAGNEIPARYLSPNAR